VALGSRRTALEMALQRHVLPERYLAAGAHGTGLAERFDLESSQQLRHSARPVGKTFCEDWGCGQRGVEDGGRRRGRGWCGPADRKILDEPLVLRGRQFAFLPEEVDELALAGMVRIHQLGHFAIRAERRCGRERGPHQHVEVGPQPVEGLHEVLGCGSVSALGHLEPGREAHALPDPVGRGGPLDDQLYFARAQRHASGRPRSEKTYSRSLEPTERAGEPEELPSFTYFHTVTIKRVGYCSVRGRMEATRARHPAAHSGADSDDCETSDSRGLCPVLAAIGVIGTEWRLAIVHRLLDGPQRFSEILKSNTHLNAKTLSATLKFLENQGVVQRTVVSTRPFSVVYSLTEMGLGLAPAARELRAWGERWVLSRHQASVRSAASTRRPTAIQGELPHVVIAEPSGRRGQ